MESEPMLTPREKSPLSEKFSLEEDWTNDAASSRTVSPTHYQPAIPDPIVYFKETDILSGAYFVWNSSIFCVLSLSTIT